MRERLEEHKRKIEERERAGEADDESEVEAKAPSCRREQKLRERLEEKRQKIEEQEWVEEVDDEREVGAPKQSCQ